jgi:hypothetical protein
MSSKENERLFDLRVVERNIRKGIISRKDLERVIKSLPDRADNAVKMAEIEDAAAARAAAQNAARTDAMPTGGNSVGGPHGPHDAD